MDLIFSDIVSSLSDMRQQDIPKGILLTKDNGKAQKTLFADHLRKQVEKEDSKGEASFQKIGGVLKIAKNSESQGNSFPLQTDFESLRIILNSDHTLSSMLKKNGGGQSQTSPGLLPVALNSNHALSSMLKKEGDSLSQTSSELFRMALNSDNGLSSMLKKKGEGQSQASPGLLRKSQNSNIAISLLSKELKKDQGVDFIPTLKEVLLNLSNGDLKNLAIDTKGLEALKKPLLKAGFKETDINDILDEFLEKAKIGKVTMADVMGKLSDLSIEEKPEEKVQPESFLEISALPFFESILSSLGIKKEEIQKIIAEADKGEKGISLDIIIEKLGNLQKNSDFTQISFKTLESDDNYKHLLKQLGMEQDEEKTSPLTLNEFINALEKLQKKLSQGEIAFNSPEVPEQGDQALTVEKTSDLFTALFKGLEQLNQPDKSAGLEFSYDQIKTQFENKLLLPDDKSTTGNTLFSADKDLTQGSDTKQKDINKNFETFLNQKKNNEIDPGDLQKEARGTLKQLKSETLKSIDPVQGSEAGVKTMDLQSGTTIAKSKPSLADLPAYVTHQVSKSLVKAINQGENILRIQLKPPELGRLVMTLDNSGDNMKVSIMTDNQTTKEILVSSINDIKTALSNSGVNLERFDVDMNSNFQQSMADTRNQTGNSNKRQQGRTRLSDEQITGLNMDDPAKLQNMVSPDGSLHYVA